MGNEACLIDFERIDISRLGTIPARAEEFERSIRRWLNVGAVRCSRKIPLRATLKYREEVKLLPPQLIPASTLKGYIRTALLHKLIMEVASSQGAQAVAKLLTSRVNLFADPKSVGTALELELLDRPRPKKQGGYADVLQRLLVSEPRVVKASSSLTRASVIDVGGGLIAELALEVLEPGSTLEYGLRILGSLPLDSIKVHGDYATAFSNILQLYESLTSQSLLDSLAEFGRALLDHELDKVKRFYKPLADKGFDFATYREILERLASESCIPVRLGFATGHTAKTIAIAMQKLAPQLYSQLCKTMTQRLGRSWDDSTFKLVNFDRKWFGLGWAKLCTT
jgi:CRISPR-associated protein Csm5